MSRTEKLFHLHNLLRARRRPVSRQVLMAELDCSQPTVYRLVAELRDALGAPIEQDPESRGFYYDRSQAAPFDLPGVWLSPSELQALVDAQALLGDVQPGLLADELNAVHERIAELLAAKGLDPSDVARRIKIIRQGGRLVPDARFGEVLTAMTANRRLSIAYHARDTDAHSERVISPQRLVHYHGNWYLDAWCHLRDGLRTFALERIEHAAMTADEIRTVGDAELEAHYRSSYGIFGGQAQQQAVLRFSAERARWVADEHWHHQASSRRLDDGDLELTVPYGRDDELVMDILKHGPHVEVIAPATLRATVAARLQQTLEQYIDG